MKLTNGQGKHYDDWLNGHVVFRDLYSRSPLHNLANPSLSTAHMRVAYTPAI